MLLGLKIPDQRTSDIDYCIRQLDFKQPHIIVSGLMVPCLDSKYTWRFMTSGDLVLSFITLIMPIRPFTYLLP